MLMMLIVQRFSPSPNSVFNYLNMNNKQQQRFGLNMNSNSRMSSEQDEQ
jgi:hypothetical protein